MVAEQIFSWLSKYKKQFVSMGKLNGEFFIHCMCVERNEYIMNCRAKGSEPLLPNVSYNDWRPGDA